MRNERTIRLQHLLFTHHILYPECIITGVRTNDCLLVPLQIQAPRVQLFDRPHASVIRIGREGLYWRCRPFMVPDSLLQHRSLAKQRYGREPINDSSLVLGGLD
ncbi:hypothetical protein BHS05_04565 [Myxococcus xanthus]|nr:hypothetical protein BHS05_04565 [Myxococcus xanthus]